MSKYYMMLVMVFVVCVIAVDFADRFWYISELKKNKLRAIMQKPDNHLDADMAMIRIQALEWTQGQIQDIIVNNVTTDWPTLTNRLVICLLEFLSCTS